MDFRMRLLKENKQSSNSNVELPKHMDFYTPKSAEKQSMQKIRQLQSKLNSLVESQKVENGHNSQLFSTFGLSLTQLQRRIVNIEKICLITTHATLSEKQQIASLKPKESVSQQDTPKSRKKLLPQTKGGFTEQSYCFTNLLTNSKFNVPDSSSKGIESLRTQFEGKLKALTDKIFLDFNIKSQFSTKQKQEQDQTRFLQFQKKCFDVNSKMKKDIQQQLLRKVSKMVEQQTQKMTKKIDVSISSAKKQILNDIEKDRCVCLEQINKLRVEMDGKVKARNERVQYNPKKQAENKKKQQEIKTKIDQINKKMNEMNNKVKSEILSQIDRHRIKNEESIIKLKGEWKLEITDVKSLLQANTRDTASQLFKLSSQMEELTKITRDKQASRQVEHLLKQQLLRQIQIISDRLNIMHKSLQQKINTQTIQWKQSKQSISSQLRATNELVNKLQVRIFAENQQNKSVYHKMSSDLLEMTDSITLILTEMKPYRQ